MSFVQIPHQSQDQPEANKSFQNLVRLCYHEDETKMQRGHGIHVSVMLYLLQNQVNLCFHERIRKYGEHV